MMGTLIVKELKQKKFIALEPWFIIILQKLAFMQNDKINIILAMTGIG